MFQVKLRAQPDLVLDPRASMRRYRGRPNVSVVAVAGEDSPAVLKGIADRAARWERLGVELILVCARRTRWSAESSAGGARVIYGPATATDSQLRTIGLEAATGDVVMLLGDPAAADDHWIERLTAAGRIGDAHRDS